MGRFVVTWARAGRTCPGRFEGLLTWLFRFAKKTAAFTRIDRSCLSSTTRRLLTDLRLCIGDLRLAVRPEQGLGAVVGARLQQFGATTGLTVGLRLSESTYRLPTHVESLIYRLILDVLSDARKPSRRSSNSAAWSLSG